LRGSVISNNGISTQQIAYEYNVAGIRTKSTVNNVEIRYLLDENRQYAQVLEEYSNNGPQSRYVYGMELGLLSQTRGTATSFYLEDGHSGVRQLANSAGESNNQYGYDSYGNVIYAVGSTQNTYQYRGEQSDPNLGMQYLRARYYNTENGRFASADPFEGYSKSPISRHRYVYANNNSTNFSDPSGKFSLPELTLTQQIGLQLLGIGLGAGLVYSGLGFGIASLSGGYTKWNGIYAKADFSIPGKPIKFIEPSGSAIIAAAGTEANQGTQLSGAWLILLAGVGAGYAFPVEFAQFSAFSPKLFSGNSKNAEASLSGPIAYVGAGLSFGIGPFGEKFLNDWSYFTMGLGYGLTEGDSFNITAEANLMAGISIPSQSFSTPTPSTPKT
jgi:RHS repeat-associated protein